MTASDPQPLQTILLEYKLIGTRLKELRWVRSRLGDAPEPLKQAITERYNNLYIRWKNLQQLLKEQS